MNSIFKSTFVAAIALSLVGITGCRCCDCDCANAPRPRHVVFFALDGWSSAYFDSDVKMPNFRRLMAEGSWTTEKRSVLPSSSAINWASIYMAAGPEQHGYVKWNSTKSQVPLAQTLPNGRFPDVFSLCRAADPTAKLGFVYEWEGQAHLIDTNVCDFVRQTPKCVEEGVDFLIRERPRLMVFGYDHPDHEGHAAGFGSPQYRQKLEELDGFLGELLASLERAGMLRDTVVIVTSDHGGIKKGHGSTSYAEMTSPFVICGPGIRRGHQIRSAVYSYDVGATIARLLDIKLPQICIGRAITESFE